MSNSFVRNKESDAVIGRGFTLIEVVIALGMVSIVVSTLLPIVTWLISRSAYLRYDAQASLLLQEGMEVSYNIAVSDWDVFLASFPDGIYHPAVDVAADPDKWTLVSGPETGLKARFSRQVIVDPVCRDDVTGEMIEGSCGSGSSWDTDSRNLKTTILWKEGQSDKQISSQLLVTNLAR